MKLKDYIKALQKIEKTNPNLTVIYAADDEGNRFDEVQFSPTVGRFDGEEFNDESKKPNAVCVN